MNLFLCDLLRRPVAVAMLILAAAVVGLYQAFHLPLELSPEVDLPKLAVTATWLGSTPENVEAFVTSPIEAVAHTLPHVRKVTSESSEGHMRVELEFNRRAEMDFIRLELAEKLSYLTQELPIDLSAPQIENYVPKEFQTEAFLEYHLTGNMALHELRTFAMQQLRPPLLALNGIAEVEVLGGEERELHVLVDRAKLAAHKLTLENVQQTLAAAQLRQQVGRLTNAAQHVDLVFESFDDDIDLLAQLPIQQNGASLILRQIAALQLQIVSPLLITRIDGEPAVLLRLLRQPGVNALRVADHVYQKLEEVKKIFPGDLRLLKAEDETAHMRAELRDLLLRSSFSLLVVSLALLLFLRSWRAMAIVLASIFIAVLCSLNLFGAMGLGLNLLTLAGFALGFGMLVDNAIVVVENIARLRALNKARVGAETSGPAWRRAGTGEATEGLAIEITIAAQGTAEVGVAILTSTLTTIVAFIPVLYLAGELREYYQSFALAVCTALAASLLVAFTMTPTLVAHLRRCESTDHNYKSRNCPFSFFSRSATQPQPLFRLQAAYQRLLAVVIRYPWAAILLALALCGGSAYLFLKKVQRGSPWKWGEETYLLVWAQLPTGAQLEKANAIVRFFEERIVGQSQVERVFARVSADYASLRITFPKAVQFSAFPHTMKEQLAALASRFAGIRIGVYGFGPGFALGSGNAPQYRLRVLGYGYNEVKKFAEGIGSTLSRHPRVREVNTTSSGWNASEENFETVLTIDRQKLPAHGLTVQSTMSQLGAYLREDFTRQEIQLDGQPLIYRIKYADFDRFEMQDLFRLTLRSAKGQPVYLREVAHIEEKPTQSFIAREDQQYQRWVTFEFRGPWKQGNRYLESIIQNTHLPPGYKLEQPQLGWRSEKDEIEIWKGIGLALLLVFMVIAALFESLKQPLIIITAVPMALVGVVLIFWLTSQPFDRSAYIGVMLLGGIVLNNAIIMMDHINQLHRHGLEKTEAVIRGAANRLRPLLMTAMTTIAGLLPMIIAADKTGLWYALALATVGGMASSTLLILILIPALCAIVEL